MVYYSMLCYIVNKYSIINSIYILYVYSMRVCYPSGFILSSIGNTNIYILHRL